MPSPLGSNGAAPTPGGSATGSAAGAPRSSTGKAFGQMLQDGTGAAGTAPAPPKPGAGTSPAAPGTPAAGSDGDANRPPRDPAGSEPAAAEATAPAPAAPAAPPAATDKDSAADVEDAPWPPLGLAGLVLAVPSGVEPVPVAPQGAAAAAGSAGLPAAGATLPATALAGTASTATPMAADAATSAAGDAEASGLPLPELITAATGLDRADDADGLQIGDRTPPAPLQPPLPAALQDLKAALAHNSIFSGEPTPKPVLGDDGFDQAIGARIGWLAEQKIGHAHIRLNPEDLGPVDVRLQMNGDKVHASFSSPHVDVRQALESSLPRLRELLGEQGFQLAHADVGHQAPGGDGNPSGASAGRGGSGRDGEPSPGDTTVSAAQLIRQRGLLDAYA
ncbi:flagellar hook-length control protein FliK [Stenotrophomonas maltophilia]|uniref:flagellar hook-length control protein FliK n=1 Tax=Stenotrophomonas maltophilia TaxID=40324 RepID=UPI0034DB02F8